MPHTNEDVDGFLTQDFNLPALPDLDEAAPTLDNNIQDAISDSDVEKAKYFTGKIKYKNKGVRASKDLFLMNPSSHPAIESTYFTQECTNKIHYYLKVLDAPAGTCQDQGTAFFAEPEIKQVCA